MKGNKSATETALKLITRRRISSTELRTKMKAKGFKEEDIEKAISYLTELKYLNDEELLDDYIILMTEKKKYGPERVAASLVKKGYEKATVINRIHQLFTEDIIIKNAKLLLRKKLKDSDINDPKVKEKAIRILLYNGYNWELIERII